MTEIALEARHVSKFFPGVKALQGVALSLAKGSIHALLGENGAGKSTLIKIITGVYRPDEGELVVGGEKVGLFNTRHAMALGIGVVHQERNLIPRFSVGENIMLEQLAGRLVKPIDYDEIHARARHWLDMLGLDLDPRTPVSRLSVAKMQLVEIAKALSLRSKVLLLDEPTASLTPHETDALFRLLRKLRDDGVGMLFVSHKLEEVQAICDAVTVLRDGRNACESRGMAGLDRQDLVRLMIGRGRADPRLGAPAITPAPLRCSNSTNSRHRSGIATSRFGSDAVRSSDSTGSSGRDGRSSPNPSSAFIRSRPER